MYNKYMQNDMNAFSELYRPVEYETEREQDIQFSEKNCSDAEKTL